MQIGQVSARRVHPFRSLSPIPVDTRWFVAARIFADRGMILALHVDCIKKKMGVKKTQEKDAVMKVKCLQLTTIHMYKHFPLLCMRVHLVLPPFGCSILVPVASRLCLFSRRDAPSAAETCRGSLFCPCQGQEGGEVRGP
jgi:hypothetical protein